MSQEDDFVFESEVSRIARAKWPQAQFGGATIIGGRERDGVYETDEVIHFVEATTSRRADKAKEDTKKLFQLISAHQKSGSLKGAIGWFVTKSEPTAEQRDAVKLAGKNQIKAVSFSQFQQSVIDVGSYFSRRENHLFGSVADPITGDVNYKGGYIQLDLLLNSDSSSLRLKDVVNGLSLGKTYVVLGEYGAGKSMTLREIYFDLKKKYQLGGESKFPVYINLREHSGQDDASELLERHARKIGFDKPSNLVAAWRAGFVILIVDGFDEITSLGISLSRSRLKEARRRSLEAVRKLLEQTPKEVGYIIAGREHFFSSPDERNGALSIRKDSVIITLGELNREQVDEYLKGMTGGSSIVPDWLPTRPLLVSYLANRGVFKESDNIFSSIDAISGWDALLDRIFERESKISPSLDGPTLRAILERLATIARATSDGLGPLTQDQIRNAYIQVCDSEPDDQANLLLQRLPGLGVYRHEDDSRTFVDVELASICRSKDLVDFIKNPYDTIQDDGWLSSIKYANDFVGQSAITKIIRDILNLQISFDSVFQSLKSVSGVDVLRADLAMVCCQGEYGLKNVCFIENAIYENFEFCPPSTVDLSKLKFKDCIFGELTLGDSIVDSYFPFFESCLFLQVNDRSCFNDLPEGKFLGGCEFENFLNNTATQSGILGSGFTRGERLILTILRKVFIQSLGGRSETALVRGLDLNLRPYVPDAIRLLQQHNLLTPYNKGDGNVWIPVRKELNRVRRILGAPSTCDDPLLREAKKIAG